MFKKFIMVSSGRNAKFLFSLLRRKGLNIWKLITPDLLIDVATLDRINHIKSDDEFPQCLLSGNVQIIKNFRVGLSWSCHWPERYVSSDLRIGAYVGFLKLV